MIKRRVKIRLFSSNLIPTSNHHNTGLEHTESITAIMNLFEVLFPGWITLLLAGAFLLPDLFKQPFDLSSMPCFMASRQYKPLRRGEIAKIRVRKLRSR